MNDLMTGESPSRQWFALDNGYLKPLGDCGDFEAADEIATDLGMELNWLVSPEMAHDWGNVLASRGINVENGLGYNMGWMDGRDSAENEFEQNGRLCNVVRSGRWGALKHQIKGIIHILRTGT